MKYATVRNRVVIERDQEVLIATEDGVSAKFVVSWTRRNGEIVLVPKNRKLVSIVVGRSG